MKFRDQQGVLLQVISAYKPCKNRKGNQSVWTQQVNYFRRKGKQNPDPIKLFDEHLIAKLKTWIEQGDNIILGIDMNEDARNGGLAKQLKQLNLHNMILDHHNNLSPPSTPPSPPVVFS